MVSDFYPPIVGGMEREVQLLSEGLSKKDCEVAVCTIKQESLPKFREENGVKVYRLEGLFQKLPFLFKTFEMKYHPPVVDWFVTNRLKDIIEKEEPDVIHTHGWILHSVLPLKKKFDMPLCVSFHDFGFICPRRSLPIHRRSFCNDPLSKNCIICGRETYGLIKSFFVYLGIKSNEVFPCDVIIYTNPHIAEKMDHMKQRKVYLPHPVDTDEYRPMGIEEYENRILCWTKLDKSKGIDTIFKVAKQLVEYQFDIPFVGSASEYYKAIKPENVHLIPKCAGKGIPKLIAKYPLVLGQFRLGAFGLSELEAMSCGKPVIAYWETKYDSFYEGPCPILSSRNVKDIVRLIKLNIGNKNLGRLNRKWILRNHSTSKVINKLIKIYEEVSK